MPQGGTIALRTQLDDSTVIIEVSDTGVGMTREVRQRCLDPFFSTKTDQGTGMGLAVSFGIVQRHHGQIVIESERTSPTFVALPRRDFN